MRPLRFKGSSSRLRAESIFMETTGTIQQDDAKQDSGTVEWQLQRLPGPVVDSFTPEQRQAVIAAIDASWSQHPVDIRFSVPWFGGSYFVTVISGQERRGRERRKQEEKTHPLVTFGNLLFSLIFAFIFFVGLTTLGFVFLFVIGRITL